MAGGTSIIPPEYCDFVAFHGTILIIYLAYRYFNKRYPTPPL